MEDKRDILYNNLIKSGKVTTEQIGSIDDFKTSIKDEKSAREFHKNLIGAGFSQEDIGSDDDFFSSIASDFKTPESEIMPEPLNIGERPAQGELAAKYKLPTSNLKIRIDKTIDETGNWKEERELDRKQMPDLSDLGTYKIQGERFDREKLLSPVNNVQQNDNIVSQIPLEKAPATNTQLKNVVANPKDITSTAKPYLDSYENIRDHYFSRFSMTDEGKQAQADLAETQKDFVDILAARLKESQAYKNIMTSTAAPADKDTAIQTLWETEYKPVLEKQIQPFFNDYFNKVMKRYSLEMGNDVKKLDQSVARNSWESIGGRIAEYEGELDKRKGGWQNVGSPTYESNVSRIQREANSKDLNEKSRQVSAAKSMMEGSQKMIEAADAESGSNFFEGLGRGFTDEAFNLDNWTMGLKGLADGQACLNVLEKYDKGMQLTKEEELLMDAMVSNAATQAYFQSELGRGYKAGSVTGVSLPFMVDMLTGVATVSAGTKASTKGLMKWLAKNYTKNAAQKNIAKGITGLTKGIVDSSIHTASLGMGRVANDYTQREIGNVTFENNGTVPQYVGRESAESGLGTAAKAFVSTGLETQSELIGNQFAPVLKFVGKQIMKMPGLRDIPASDFGKYVKDIYNSASAKSVREFAKRAQFQGPIAEYAEEVYNNLGNVIIGDMTPEQLVDLDQNIDTFLGVGVMSAAFGLTGTGAFIRERYKTGKEIKSFEDKMKEYVDFDRLKVDLQQQDIQGARDFVKQVMTDPSLSSDEKKEEIRYIANVLKEAAMNSVEIETGEESLSPDDIKENKATIYSEFETTRKNVESALPSDIINRIDTGEDINSIMLSAGLDERQRDAAVDYQAARTDFNNYIASVRSKVADAQKTARHEVEGVSNPDMGAVVRVNSNLSSDPMHIVGGKLAFDEEGFVDESNSSDIIYYIDESGKRKMAAPSAFISLVDMNDTESIAQQAEADAEMQITAKEQAQLPQEYIPAVGDEVSTQDGIRGTVTRFTPEADAIVSDEEKDYVVPLNNILSQNESINEGLSPSEESNLSKNEVLSENENSALTVQEDTASPISKEAVPVKEQSSIVSPIPVDDKGNPVYHKAKIEDTIADLTDGALEDIEIDDFISANRKEAMDNLTKLEKKLPKMGTNKAKYLQEKAAHQAKMKEEQQRIAYWNSVEKEIKSMREKPGDAVAEEILSMEEPMNGEEFAAQQLANGNLPLLQSSFGSETGFGKDEIKKYFGLFSSGEKGGMTIQEAGEALMQSDRENGTNFFDQNDPNAGRDAIINVLSQATTRSDLANITKNNREAAAERERAAEYAAYETFTQESFHMTPKEYETHEEVALPVQTEKYKGIDVNALFDDIIDNEYGKQEEGIAGSDAILQEEKPTATNRTTNIGSIELQNDTAPLQTESSSGNKDNTLQEKMQENAGNLSDSEEFETQASQVFVAPSIEENENILDYASRIVKEKEIHDVRQSVDTSPTDAQKEAGNYKKGHIKLDGYDITIENPKGSERFGTDTNGQSWSITMNNDYGYIRGTKAVDGDHIDIFLSNNPTEGNVFVIDQLNEEGFFDESKVMYGFPSLEDARIAYLSNYSPGWESRISAITEVSKDEFKKWIDSSIRKTKPFSEYNSVNPISSPQKQNRLVTDERYAELRERMRKRLTGQMNMGIDPEILAIGTEMAVYHIEKGTHKFVEYAKAMISDLGDEIRPYLKAFYNGARELPEMEEAGMADKMDSYNEVRQIDSASIGRTLNIIETAETIVKEQEVEKQVIRAKSTTKKSSQKSKKNKNVVPLQRQTNDLFNEQFNNETNETVQGLVGSSLEERTKRQPSDKDGKMGRSQRNEVERTERSGMDNHSSSDVRNDAERSGRTSELSERKQRLKEERKNQRNNRAERGTNYAPKSPSARFKANVEAIRTLREIEESGKLATPQQIETLRKFSGWGGISMNSETKEYRELSQLLTSEELKDAELSGNTAYYTPAHVIDVMWDVATRLGFKGGKVLEGSAGIGNIIGAMPETISRHSDIQAVEIDRITGGILRALYPDTKVDVKGFQDVVIPARSVDLAITNVPFVTGLSVIDKKNPDLSKKFKNIHDFCIAKNVRALREGGIGIFISTSGTMDKSTELRKWITQQGNADFIGAFRLNNETFVGTKVTSDIIVIRKRTNGRLSPNSIDVQGISAVRKVDYTYDKSFNRTTHEWEDITKPLVLIVNSYFEQHPNHMGGAMKFGFEVGETFRPESSGLYPEKNDISQNEKLTNWIEQFKEEQTATAKQEQTANEKTDERTGTMVVNNKGELCQVMYGEKVPLDINSNKVKGYTKAQCLEDYKDIRDAINAVLDYQTKNKDNKGLMPLLTKLNNAYDTFAGKYGTLNRNTSISFLKNDIDFPSIAALETYKEIKTIDGKTTVSTSKSDIFQKRMIGFESEPKPQNITEGVITSIYKHGNINLNYISEKLGMSVEQVKHEILDKRLGFENPATGGIEVDYEYLSGNVREKLAVAMANNTDGKLNANIEELQKVIPMDIPAHLIEFSIGSSWIEPKIFDDFFNEKYAINLNCNHIGDTWVFNNKKGEYNEKNRLAGVHSEMCNKLISGSTLAEAAMNNLTIKVQTIQTGRDAMGNKTTETITDKEATQSCGRRIQEIKDEFKEWAQAKMQQDEELAERMSRLYNDKFNALVPKRISGQFLPERFEGASNGIKLYRHQKQAVVRGTTQNLMLAHEVGTGKTFTLISTAMEMRRLGTAKKPCIVVQNATVQQFVNDAKELYPNAKILTLEENDRNPEGRMKFYAKIKYNDWDMIVIPQSVLNLMPDSEARKNEFINEKLEEKQHILDLMEQAGADEKEFKNAQKELQNMQEAFMDGDMAAALSGGRKKSKGKDKKKEAVSKEKTKNKAERELNRRTDEVTDFDDMGIDAILVDEAHNYKRLGFSTAIKGVKGIDTAGSTYSVSLYLKTRSVMEKSGGKNVIFATGTPISNTAAEIWTFMKYLLPKETMDANDMYYFDDFVRNFGNINQMVEFATNGKFKENTRFASYINKPELIRIWATTADTVLTKDAESKDGKKLSDKLPVMETGKAQDIFLPQTKGLRRIMKFVKAELEKFEQMSGKEKKEHSSIPLVMFGIAKRAAIDPRLVDNNAEDEPGSKVNRAIEEILKSLKQTDSYHGTIAIFCDQRNGVNGFDLFHELKNKLVKKGISPDKVVVMESGMSNTKKQKIFDAVNSGEVRVIIGTTASLGTGVNIQERLHTLIHMDAPNRPMDYTQRNGRILRQGNLHKEWNKEVRVLRFGVEDSLDVTAYQRLKTKARFIDSIMDGQSALDNNQVDRVLEEEEEGVFDNPVAVLSGSEYAILKTQAEREYRKYSSRKQQYEQDQVYIGGMIKRNNAQININRELIAEEQNTLDILQQNFPTGKVKCIYIGNVKCADDASLEVRLTEINKMINEATDAFRKDSNQNAIDIPIHIRFDKVDVQANIHATKKSEYVPGKGFAVRVSKQISYTSPTLGIENAIKVGGGYIRGVVDVFREEVATGKTQRENIEGCKNSNVRMANENKMFAERYGKSFEFEKELGQAKKQVEEYDKLMQEELKAKEEKYKDEEIEGSFDLNKAVDAVFEEESPENSEARFRDSDESIDDDINRRPDKEIISSVKELSDKLHTPVHIVRNIDELPDEAVKHSIEKGRNIKGWLEPRTEQVAVYLPNIFNAEDARRTVFHEVVSHYGLRKMFGKDFDTFLDNVYANAEESIQKNINDRSSDKRIATEEYLSELAERGFEDEHERTFWQKIKDFFIGMLRKNGVNLGFKLSDNELRYILWKSYQNLKDDNVIDIARNIAKQYELKVGDYRFRDDVADKASDGSREEYEISLKGNKYRFQEAYQDSMLALKKLQEVIAKVSGKPIQTFENAYIAENQLSSKNSVEAEKYYNEYFEPLEKEIARLVKSSAVSYDELSDYMILKHGVERNIEFSVRDAIKRIEKDQGEDVARQMREDYGKDKEIIIKDLENEVIGEEEYLHRLEEIGLKYTDTISDYSATRTLLGKLTGGELSDGLNGDGRTDAYIQMFEDSYGKDADVMALANDAIKNFESGFEASTLWKKVNAATKHPLRKSYESGLMSKESYGHINKMFRFYVPLRGWNEKTADDIYEYLSSERSPVNSVLKTAKGRKSIPDNPIPVIGNMAESTILQGNKNLMKQSFMSMVMNHTTDVVTIKKAWYVKNPVTDEWSISFPDIEENDSAQDIDKKIEEHEERMRELEKTGEATQKTQGLNINYHIESVQAKEHIVSVKRNGKDYIIYINGNPRAAQAINGLTNPDMEKHPMMKAIGTANRWLAANFTTRNPAFVLSNLSRDLIFAQSAALVKESPEYAGKFFVNVPKAMKSIMSNLNKNGDMDKEANQYFKEFIENGGETGYMTLTDVDKYKKRIKNDLERLTGKEGSAKDALRYCVDRLEDFNRWAEDVSRFTIYMTSRQMGRSITESVNDAKEITVNFNKKGAGFKTGGFFGISAGLFKGLYLFFNAGVQSLANFGRLAKGNPVKFGAMLGGFATAGFVIPALVNQFLFAALGGGDDDPYKDLPDWVRRNNLCLYCGYGKFVTIPLPIELRAFYGLGDMAYQYTTTKGKIKPTEMAYDMANQITELLPLNPLGHNGDIVSTLMPDALKPFWQINQNEDFTGKLIWKKTAFNELDPEFKRVYKGTSGWLMDASQFLNEISGGSDFRKGALDINPAKIEHLFESYFGGMGKTFNQLGKTLWYGAKSIAEDEKNGNLKLRNVPVLNRFITDIDEKSAFSGMNKEYYRMVDEFETIDHEVNGLTQKASLMNPKYLDEYTRLTNTAKFGWYKSFETIKKDIDRLQQVAKSIPDEKMREEIEILILDAKRTAVSMMEENSKTTIRNRD